MGQAWTAIVEWFNVDRLAAAFGAIGLVFGFAGMLYGARGHKLQKHQATIAEVVRQQGLQPMVVVSVSPATNDRDVLILCIENIGPSIAKDVRIRTTPPLVRSFDQSDATPMHQWHVFTDGIPALPPKARLEYMFEIGSRYFQSDLPRRYRFEVDANGPAGAVETLVYDIDLEPMRDLWVGQTTIASIVTAVNSLGKTVGSIAPEIRAIVGAVQSATDRTMSPSEIATIAKWATEESAIAADPLPAQRNLPN